MQVTERHHVQSVSDKASTREEPAHWYAYKIFHNKAQALKNKPEQQGLWCYIPVRPNRIVKAMTNQGEAQLTEMKPVIPSLMFIRSSELTMTGLRDGPDKLWVYCQPSTNVPAVIPDREMEIFIFVTAKGCQFLESINQPLVKGDRVRVIGGILQGDEGYITRVHGTKRFVVIIDGVAAIATGYIPKQFLEKIH